MTAVPSTPPPPTVKTVKGRLEAVSRWRGDPDPETGKRPEYVKRWYNLTKRQADARYYAWLRRWQDDPLIQDPRRFGTVQCIGDLADAYIKVAESTYIKDGKSTSFVWNVRGAMTELKNAHGNRPIDFLRPTVLAKLRDTMVFNAQGKARARTTVNLWLDIIRQAYRWGVEKEHVNVNVWQSLTAVSKLKKNRSAAKEQRRVTPVHWSLVEQTAAKCSDTVRAMIMVQWYTGMRPEEACMMRGCDLDQSGAVWVYTPHSHKTDHLEDQPTRRIALGPKAQDAIGPFLVRRLDAFLFSPIESSKQQGRGSRPDMGDCYTTTTYRRAIHRACKRAGCPQWNPNQLRHAWGTRARQTADLETAKAGLGHTRVSTTEIYAERDLNRAMKIALKIG